MNREEYRAFYERQALSYGNDHLTRDYIRVQFILNNLRPGDIVLEIGCQSGGITRFIAELADFVVAVDVAENYIKKARKIVDRVNVLFKVGFGEDINPKEVSPSGGFDVVVLMEILEHVEEPRRLLYVTKKVLFNGGKVLITVPDENYVDPLGEHKTVFTRESFEDLIKKHFQDYIIFKSGYEEEPFDWYFCVATKGNK